MQVTCLKQTKYQTFVLLTELTIIYIYIYSLHYNSLEQVRFVFNI